MKTHKFNLYTTELRNAANYLGTMLPKSVDGNKLSVVVDYAPLPDTMYVSVVIGNETIYRETMLELPVIDNLLMVPSQAPRFVAKTFRREVKAFTQGLEMLKAARKYFGKKEIHWSELLEVASTYLSKHGDKVPTEGNWEPLVPEHIPYTIDDNGHLGDVSLINHTYGKAVSLTGMKHCIPPLPKSAQPTDLVIPEPLHSSGKTMTTEALLAEKGLKLVTLKNRTPSTDINIFPQGTGLDEVLQEGGQLNTMVVPKAITQRNEAWLNHQVVGCLKAKPECGDNIKVDGVSHYVGRALEDDEYICTTDSGDKVIVRRVDGEFKHVGGIERDVMTRTRTIVYFDGTTKTL